MEEQKRVAIDQKRMRQAESEALEILELLRDNPSVASINVVFWTDVYKLAEEHGQMGVKQ